MPGINSTQQPSAVHAPDWAVYREDVGFSADSITHPLDVTEVIDLGENASGISGQIWITAERTAGAGTCKLSLFRDTTGSVNAVNPVALVTEVAGVVHLQEVRFTDLQAVPHRVLVTDVAIGAAWTLHYTFLSVPSV